MWYPPQQQQQQQHQQQQQQCWHGYIHHLSPSNPQKQQQQTYTRTSYYCNTDESLNINQATSYNTTRYDENESLIHYHSTRVDDVYVTGTDYYVTTSTGSYTDEMSSYQTSNTNWNPVITAPIKSSVGTINNHNNNHNNNNIKPSSSSTSSSACWDWLLYSPDIYSHLYIPSSSFIYQQQQDDDFDLLASLPTWLLALLYPSMKILHTMDDENDNDQEISSLNHNNNNNTDEPLLTTINIENKINHVSSNLSLSSENIICPNIPKTLQQNRSSTPDTDDGYQSASDASRSDYSQQSSLQYEPHNSKDDITINVPSSLITKRLSYAAAVKPIGTPTTPITTTINNSSSISMIKTTKTISPLLTANDLLTNNNNNNNGSKSKFIAPRFERMHHAKQYTSSTSTTIPSSNRTQIRSNNNHNQRNHIINSSRRR